MTTEAQINANRANAQHSTGPKTPEGKAISSRNFFRHGLRAKVVLDRAHEFPNGTPDLFDGLYLALINDLKPLGAFEHLCVEQMAVATWRLQFVVHKEIDLLNAEYQAPYHEECCDCRFRQPSLRTQNGDSPAGKPALLNPTNLQALIRYEAHLERQFYRAHKEMMALRAERRRQAESEETAVTPCQPFSDRCEISRDLHARQNLEQMKKQYNPPPFHWPTEIPDESDSPTRPPASAERQPTAPPESPELPLEPNPSSTPSSPPSGEPPLPRSAGVLADSLSHSSPVPPSQERPGFRPCIPSEPDPASTHTLRRIGFPIPPGSSPYHSDLPLDPNPGERPPVPHEPNPTCDRSMSAPPASLAISMPPANSPAPPGFPPEPRFAGIPSPQAPSPPVVNPFICGQSAGAPPRQSNNRSSFDAKPPA